MLNNMDAIATIGVKNLEAAKQFYEKKLGLKPLNSVDGEVQTYSSGKSIIEVYHSDFAGTNKATALTWEVSDVANEVKALKEKGISFEHYNFPDVKMEGDVHVMGDLKAAWFKDPDGNILCMANKH